MALMKPKKMRNRMIKLMRWKMLRLKKIKMILVLINSSFSKKNFMKRSRDKMKLINLKSPTVMMLMINIKSKSNHQLMRMSKF